MTLSSQDFAGCQPASGIEVSYFPLSMTNLWYSSVLSYSLLKSDERYGRQEEVFGVPIISFWFEVLFHISLWGPALTLHH